MIYLNELIKIVVVIYLIEIGIISCNLLLSLDILYINKFT
jgi:hypothetical protein